MRPWLRPYRSLALLVAIALLVDAVYESAFPLALKLLIDRGIVPRDQTMLLAVSVGLVVLAVALAAYRVLGCRDLARVDVRLDAAGRAHFIELNPLPGLNPVTGDICLIAYGIGMRYSALVGSVVEHAIGRCPELQ